MKGADFMAGKDIKWWFAAILIMGALGALYALRLLLASHQKYVTGMEAQLTEQRAANTALHEKLITYITTDHLKAIDAHAKMSESMNRLATAIESLERTRDRT